VLSTVSEGTVIQRLVKDYQYPNSMGSENQSIEEYYY